MALFQARYDGLTKAYLAKNIETAGTFFAPDYSAGNYTHPLDKKSTLEELKHWDGRFKTTKRKLLSVIVNGNKASTMTDNRTEGDITDKAGVHHYVITTRCLDTWVKNQPGWQLKHSRVVNKSLTKDGKPLVAKPVVKKT